MPEIDDSFNSFGEQRLIIPPSAVSHGIDRQIRLFPQLIEEGHLRHVHTTGNSLWHNCEYDFHE